MKLHFEKFDRQMNFGFWKNEDGGKIDTDSLLWRLVNAIF